MEAHHRHHSETTKKRRGSGGSLQFGAIEKKAAPKHGRIMSQRPRRRPFPAHLHHEIRSLSHVSLFDLHRRINQLLVHIHQADGCRLNLTSLSFLRLAFHELFFSSPGLPEEFISSCQVEQFTSLFQAVTE